MHPTADFETATNAPPEQSHAAGPEPVSRVDRLLAIDVARGFALLGIFVVNVQSFGEPFGRFLVTTPESNDTLTRVLYYIQKILCEGKFYPLFSMLFGIGLILQMGSVEKRGGGFVPLYLRRLGILLAIGFIHAIGLWYGDILFFYAIFGAVLLLARKAAAKTMLVIGVSLVLFSCVLTAGMFALQSLQSQQQQRLADQRSADRAEITTDTAVAANTGPAEAPATTDGQLVLPETADSSPAIVRLFEAYGSQEITGGPEHPKFMALEIEAYRDGPWFDAMAFRIMTWLMYLFVTFFTFGWQIVGMFFIGAGLYKAGLLNPERRGLRKILMLTGLLVGLPGSALVMMVSDGSTSTLLAAPLVGLSMIFGPLISLGYLCSAAWWVDSGVMRWLANALASTGRMALTNYLSHTLIATFVFYWWGLGQFAQWTRAERDLLVVCVFAAQCVLSVLWLRVFRFGPMEWVWRSLTYLRPQPMRR